MKQIVFTLEFDDFLANKRANDYLAKGWTLLHVGQKSVSPSSEQTSFYTVYVVGANKEQYESYMTEKENRINGFEERSPISDLF